MTSSRGWGAARAVLGRPLPCRGRLEGSDQLALQRDLQTRREMGERWARGGREVGERWARGGREVADQPRAQGAGAPSTFVTDLRHSHRVEPLAGVGRLENEALTPLTHPHRVEPLAAVVRLWQLGAVARHAPLVDRPQQLLPAALRPRAATDRGGLLLVAL